MPEGNGNGSLRREIKVIATTVISVALAGFLIWAIASPFNRLNDSERAIQNFTVQLATQAAQIKDLQRTVESNHEDEIKAILALQSSGKENAQTISRAVTYAVQDAAKKKK